MADPVDNVPVGIGAPRKIDAPIRSDRLPKTRTEVDTSNSGHHQGVQTICGSDPGPVFDPNANRRPRRADPISTPGPYGGPALCVSKGSALPAQAAG
jgi:hypothetical protein